MIQFRIQFEMSRARSGEFTKMVQDLYGPALERQKGFGAWRLLSLYGASGESPADSVELQLEFEFESEQDRLTWAGSDDHKPAWDAAVSIATRYEARGYDVLGGS